MSGGWNPVTGRDGTGARPTYAPYGSTMPSQGQPLIPHTGGPGYSYPMMPQYGNCSNMAYQPYANNYGYCGGAPYVGAQAQAGGYYAQHTISNQPNGVGNPMSRQPQAWPNIDSTMPAAQMTNSTGGTSCEPGYNYFFPPEHTKVHVFRSNTPPWQLPSTAQIPFKAVHIPCSTTMAELLKGFGCTNPLPKKNKCFELISGGGGKWYKGLEVNGAEKDMMKKTIKDAGWDMSRTGHPQGKPVVCLWFCKD